MIENKNGNRYAIVDLEATGTGSDAKIIQVGIVIVQDGQILQTYERDVNPHEDLTPQIQLLTGISNKRLRKAPDFGQLAEEIYRLLEDTIFVAHNVKFDGNLLAENLFFEGYDLHTPRVDTVELAQLFFPTLEKYSLSHLAKDLDLDLEQAHTAISDAMATAQLLFKIQEKIAALPKQTVGQILEFADHLIFESRLVIDEIYAGMSDYGSEDCQEVQGLMLKKESHQEKAAPISQDFSENLARLGLDNREPQKAFASLVKERLVDEKQVHFIQAQAGIGKTYGYLLPLLSESDQPLLVSVPTLVLQQQIMEKEGKSLSATFGLSVQSIKSSKHFLKLETFWQTLQREDSNRLLNRHKMQLLVWLCETETGDLDEFKLKQRYQPYFDELQHDGFLEPHSLFAEWDFWRRLHSKARKSHLLLTNHAYLLHHLKDQAYLTENRILVIDEAQKLLLTAESLTSQSLPIQPLLQQLQSSKDKAERLLERRLYESSFTDPVVFFESQMLYDVAEQFVTDGVPEGYYEIEEGEPVIRREGSDLTIACIGPTLYRVLEAADTLQEKYGISTEVIDLRFIAPLNLDLVVESVKKTGRLLLTSDAVERGSFLHDVASKVQTLAFDHLDAPVTVVGSRNAITTAAELEKEFFPQPEWLIDAVHERILPLPGHVTTSNQTTAELVRRNRVGL